MFVSFNIPTAIITLTTDEEAAGSSETLVAFLLFFIVIHLEQKATNTRYFYEIMRK